MATTPDTDPIVILSYARTPMGSFPDSGCALAIEVKKFFMDEWTGKAYRRVMEEILTALGATVPAVVAALAEVGEAAEDTVGTS